MYSYCGNIGLTAYDELPGEYNVEFRHYYISNKDDIVHDDIYTGTVTMNANRDVLGCLTLQNTTNDPSFDSNIDINSNIFYNEFYGYYTKAHDGYLDLIKGGYGDNFLDRKTKDDNYFHLYFMKEMNSSVYGFIDNNYLDLKKIVK